jgi:hypothetical protein
MISWRVSRVLQPDRVYIDVLANFTSLGPFMSLYKMHARSDTDEPKMSSRRNLRSGVSTLYGVNRMKKETSGSSTG